MEQRSSPAIVNYEASEGDTHKRETNALPAEVVQCLQNARFLHLATSDGSQPHVALMNFTYLPSSPYEERPAPVIVMTTNPRSRKTNDVTANPNVSLLVHDWSSYRPPNDDRLHSDAPFSSMANFLFSLNSEAISRISASISGTARIAPRRSEEERFYRRRHLETLLGPTAAAELERAARTEQDAERDDDVCVIVVPIRHVRVSDVTGAVRDWELVCDERIVNGA